jgi:hypothetical protein
MGALAPGAMRHRMPKAVLTHMNPNAFTGPTALGRGRGGRPGEVVGLADASSIHDKRERDQSDC